MYVGKQLAYLHRVRLALYGALGGEHADVARLGQIAYRLCRWADYAQYAARRVEHGQVALLYGAQSLCRCGVASEYHEMATHGEQLEHGLPCELVDHFKRARAIGCAGVVAEIHVVVLRQ